jgi:hypothetical protein
VRARFAPMTKPERLVREVAGLLCHVIGAYRFVRLGDALASGLIGCPPTRNGGRRQRARQLCMATAGATLR